MKYGIKKLLALLTATIVMTGSAMAGELWLTIDQVRVYEMPAPVGSIIIGNPSIADVKVRSNEQILLYGKAPGLTNIYFFDQEGTKMDNVFVRVQSDTKNMLVVHKGAARTTYSCTRNCEVTPTIGDSLESFGNVSSQAQQKQEAVIQSADVEQ
ncbi:MAG: pilus assembly protein N-terminal domain-containing protein [bacterium]